MTAVLSTLLGLGGGLGWTLWLHRRDAVAGPARFDVWVDGLPAGVGAVWYLLCLGLTGRPVFSGVCLAGGSGLLFVLNRLKERHFREPIVFLDFTLAGQVARHPGFYLPFLFPPAVAWAGVGVAAGLAGLWWLETPVPGWARVLAFVLAGAGLLAGWRGFSRLLAPRGREAALGLLARLAPTFRPRDDFARLGLFASLAAHLLHHVQVRGRDGAPGIRRSGPGAPGVARPVVAEPAPHLVLVQAESFCDLRRHRPGEVPDAALAGFDRLRAAGRGGRFLVASHGAYTMRAEFSVLTGLGPAGLGTDAFNPYFTAARQPVASLAWRLRRAGYRTVCLHPFAPGFFGRDRVLPNLGFERFLSLADFAGAKRAGPYVSDAALGGRVLAELTAADRPCFVFAISIEAHGPWTPDRFQGLAGPGPAATDPLSAYLWHLAHMGQVDGMFSALATGLSGLSRPAVLCGYGDHPPALPGVGKPGLADPTATDWFLWDSRGPGPGTDQALRPEDLAGELLAALARPA